MAIGKTARPPLSRLSEWERDEMVSLARRGWTYASLATQYGYCAETIRRYLRSRGVRTGSDAPCT